jgi:hypothetical protein
MGRVATVRVRVMLFQEAVCREAAFKKGSIQRGDILKKHTGERHAKP